jgi:Protein of unknown function (DUF3768)
MFKLEYLDVDVDGVYASEDPSDPAQTLRVMTLMLPSDYWGRGRLACYQPPSGGFFLWCHTQRRTNRPL